MLAVFMLPRNVARFLVSVIRFRPRPNAKRLGFPSSRELATNTVTPDPTRHAQYCELKFPNVADSQRLRNFGSCDALSSTGHVCAWRVNGCAARGTHQPNSHRHGGGSPDFLLMYPPSVETCQTAGGGFAFLLVDGSSPSIPVMCSQK